MRAGDGAPTSEQRTEADRRAVGGASSRRIHNRRFGTVFVALVGRTDSPSDSRPGDGTGLSAPPSAVPTYELRQPAWIPASPLKKASACSTAQARLPASEWPERLRGLKLWSPSGTHASRISSGRS